MKALMAQLVAIMAVLLAAVPSAPAPRLIMTGSGKALWLVRTAGDGRSFDVVVRPVGGRWQWRAKDLIGDVTAAVASDTNLHVVFRSGQYHIYPLSGDEGTPGLRLPATPVALCASRNFGATSATTLVAIVPRRTATQPASAEASSEEKEEKVEKGEKGEKNKADKGLPLDVIQSIEGRWEHLATLTGVSVQQAQALQAAVFDGALYVLVTGGENRLLAWKEEKWRDLSLPAILAKATRIDMVALDDRLTFISSRAAPESDRVRLAISTFSVSDGTFPEQLITREGSPDAWAAGSVLAVGRLADKLAILWQDKKMYRLSTCSPATGQEDPSPEEVTILNQPPSDDLSKKVQVYFFWAVVLLMLILLLLLKPQSVPKPFTLPDTAVAAPLGRRLAATIVDLVPFNLAMAVIMQIAMPMTVEELRLLLSDVLAGQRQLPLPIIFISIAVSLSYLVYAIVMERIFGATLGKMLFRLIVINDEGSKPGLKEAILRNVLKVMEISWMPLPWLPFPPLLLVPLLTRHHQRLGDILGRTAVIDARLFMPAPPGEADHQNQEGH